jgi:enterochelin esterase family protein
MPETHHRLKSRHLGNERSIWVIPPRDPAQPAELAVFLDAERYRDRVGAVSIIQELTTLSALANTLFVFVSEHSAEARWLECPCHPPFATFINDELLPWLESHHPSIRGASKRVLIGLSYTGLSAAYVAFRAAGRWNKVISQSGSHWANDGWLAEQYRQHSHSLPIRFYLDVGRGETAENVRHKEDVLQVISQIDGVRRFRDALQATGHEVRYVEFDGAHDYAAWSQTLPGALRWALDSGNATDSISTEQIATGYDRIAHLWTAPNFESGLAQHRRALRFSPRPGPALDIGCGASGRFITLLHENGYAPEGVDLSAEMLRHARIRHPQVTFHHADLATWQPPAGQSFISAWDCLWHLPPQLQREVLLRLGAALAPQGVLIFSAGGLDRPGEKTDAAMGVPMYYSTLGVPGYLAVFAEAGLVCRHLEYDQHPEPHVYFIAQKRD